MNKEINIKDTAFEDVEPDSMGFDGAEGVDDDENQ